jgi:hypothetical protein
MRSAPVRAALLLIAAAIAAPVFQAAQPQPASLTKGQIAAFLTTARVVNAKQTSTGITSPWRLTLTDGTLTHDAAFQSVDQHEPRHEFADGTTEVNFVDSYKFDLAAYRIAELVGLDEMMPVTVKRTWNRNAGALSWWVSTLMDERERLARKVQPPDADLWNKQMARMRVFTALVYDTDRNLTNVLIGDDWKLWMIDFTRGFRQQKTLVNEKDLLRCDRQLLERLKALDRADVTRAAGEYLTRFQIDSLMTRRDVIVQHFARLAAERGEASVLY